MTATLNDPLLTEVAALRTTVAQMERRQVRYVDAPVTAVDPASGTFTVAITNPVDGQSTLSGIDAPAHFMPDVGSTARLAVPGAQVVYTPGGIAENAVTYRELDDTTVAADITTAMSAANGKNKVTFSTSAAPASGYAGVSGDIWFQTNTSGVIVGSWTFDGVAFQPRTFGDQVLSSLTVGKLATGTFTAVMTMSGTIQTAASGHRVVIDAAGVRLFNSGSGTPVVDLNTTTGSGTYRGTIEAATIRTSATGQRLEITGGGTAGGRTITMYPAGAGGAATFYSRDDGSGNAGVSADAGGANHGFLNFTSTFADMGYFQGTGAASFVRVDGTDPVYAIRLGAATGKAIIMGSTVGIEYWSGNTKIGEIAADNSVSRLVKFATDGVIGAFTFGVNPGASDVDVYALRFISTNPGGTGGFVYLSDERLKHNIRDASFAALQQIRDTPVREFEWDETGQTDVGFVAQEVPLDAQVIVGADVEMPFPDPVGIATDKMVMLLWKAAQESADVFLGLRDWRDLIRDRMDRQVRSVEARVILPALAVGTPVDVTVGWPSGPLPFAPDSVTVGHEVPVGLLGRLATRVLPASITPTGCTVRTELLSGAPVTVGGGQLHVTGLAWR